LAEQNEILTWATGIGTAMGATLGAMLAALGLRKGKTAAKPGEPNMAERIAKLEQRADEADRREATDRHELRETLDLLFAKADATQQATAKTQTDIAEIKGMLNARKAQR
jgi:hypothetical protein